MPRYHIKNKENKWNLFSTVVDDYLFDDFVDFEKYKERCIVKHYKEDDYAKELDTLQTDKPKLNVMSYEEAEERRKLNK